MQKLKQHIHFIRQLFLVAFALFALASCSVKEPVFRAIGTDYHRPLNQTKTAQNFEHSCNLSETADFTSDKNIQVAPLKLLVGTETLSNSLIERKAERVSSPIIPHKKASDNQPLYILYKRLKFDLV